MTSDMLRSPVNDHPVESLIKLIEKDQLSTDLTLCPGDFTNRSDQQGFISSWDFVNEIHNCLKGKDLIATLGNHDVDSHEKISNYNLEVAKGIKKDFPLKNDGDRDTLWSKGCVFVESENFRILVINSAHFHYNKEHAVGGKVDSNLLDYVEEYLNEINDDKIFIALSHHHPTNHSRLGLGEHDIIVNGTELLELLGKHSCDLFIHGHKHDAFLRYHNLTESNGRIPILSSGSFSATSNTIYTGRRNHFHMIDIEKKNKVCYGRITTWTFMPKNGWKLMHDDGGFDTYTGFGCNKNIQEIASDIISVVGKSVTYKWEDITTKLPEVNYLIPIEAEKLTNLLKSQGFLIAPPLSQSPTIISNVKAVI
ncbi:metallophosphoesterase family protein [Nonlabens marinus]|uniref:metallophosphoesterase family protein n=1 Tax=Nonlabens marinus TaxID=930802 RepID=UPI0011DDAA96|nr:metallophosphoesterase [Nonlabens marinus]